MMAPLLRASPMGANGGQVRQHIMVAPGALHVHMLELRGGGQHDVGMARRIGEEVVDHHGEEILAQRGRA